MKIDFLILMLVLVYDVVATKEQKLILEK